MVEPSSFATRSWLKVTDMDERLSHIKQLKQLLVDDAGHMLHHDQPQLIADAIAGFLAVK
jgi:pimeloyl-ACP methyl ester carboxylesterase